MKVIVIDDHPLMREGIRSILENVAEDVTVVGETGDPEEAADLVRELAPDLVILDLEFHRKIRGIELCRDIKALPNAPYVLVNTAYNSVLEVSSCRLSGADSFLYKEEGPDKLPEAVERTASGERLWFIGPEDDSRSRLEEKIQQAHLTPKERQILPLLLAQKSNRRIGQELSIEITTVKTHVGNIFRKLKLDGRQDLL